MLTSTAETDKEKTYGLSDVNTITVGGERRLCFSGSIVPAGDG